MSASSRHCTTNNAQSRKRSNNHPLNDKRCTRAALSINTMSHCGTSRTAERNHATTHTGKHVPGPLARITRGRSRQINGKHAQNATSVVHTLVTYDCFTSRLRGIRTRYALVGSSSSLPSARRIAGGLPESVSATTTTKASVSACAPTNQKSASP